MPTEPTSDAYPRFLAFIRAHARRERASLNRRMLGVFLWCFLAPAALAVALLVLIRTGWLPWSARNWLEWLLLVFPVSYALLFLGSEVLRDLPNAFRQGALGSALRHAEAEAEWRREVLVSLRQELPLAAGEWGRLELAFRGDLESMRQRNRYLTALAGAVFFLLMQGIDGLGEPIDPAVPAGEPARAVASWLLDAGQFVGLALFLLLLYLAGSQTLQSLRRYLICLELISSDPGRSSP